jgi:cytochrome P450
MTLARLEAKVAFETLLARYPQMSLVDQKPAWQTNNFVRGLESLQVHLYGGATPTRQVEPRLAQA